MFLGAAKQTDVPAESSIEVSKCLIQEPDVGSHGHSGVRDGTVSCSLEVEEARSELGGGVSTRREISSANDSRAETEGPRERARVTQKYNDDEG